MVSGTLVAEDGKEGGPQKRGMMSVSLKDLTINSVQWLVDGQIL